MKSKTITIIGAGIAGLSTGCYAQMNGYQTTTFEMSGKPGGLCTSWQRKGYTFDYCIHNLAGTGERSGMRRVWDELGALQGTEVINHDVFVQVEDAQGQRLKIYAELPRLERHLKEVAPNDTRIIDDFIKAARRLQKVDMLRMLVESGWGRVRLLPHMFTLGKWGRISLDDYAAPIHGSFCAAGL